jgi:hypothetical protein
MNSKVFVVADETGAVINVSRNADYGYFRVEQTKTMVDDNGFLRRKTISAIVPSLMEDLQASGLHAGQVLEGKIVIEESLEPFNKKNPERDLKVAGETGIVCTLGGMPIYRRTKYTLNTALADTVINHDNIEELRAAYAVQQAKQVAIQPNEDFSIED